jgi:hypothetical protein
MRYFVNVPTKREAWHVRQELGWNALVEQGS